MQYRLATQDDFEAIRSYDRMCEYFGTVEADTGGNWVIALDDEGAVRGCIWEFHGQGHAYIDYWAADTPLIAATLGAMVEARLRALGVRQVWGVIAENNDAARRLARRLGMDDSGSYALTIKRL